MIPNAPGGGKIVSFSHQISDRCHSYMECSTDVYFISYNPYRTTGEMVPRTKCLTLIPSTFFSFLSWRTRSRKKSEVRRVYNSVGGQEHIFIKFRAVRGFLFYACKFLFFDQDKNLHCLPIKVKNILVFPQRSTNSNNKSWIGRYSTILKLSALNLKNVLRRHQMVSYNQIDTKWCPIGQRQRRYRFISLRHSLKWVVQRYPSI